MKPGDMWTVFYFGAPNFNPRMQSFMQHMLVFIRYAPAVPQSYSLLDELSPRVHGTWELGASTYKSCELSGGLNGDSPSRCKSLGVP